MPEDFTASMISLELPEVRKTFSKRSFTVTFNVAIFFTQLRVSRVEEGREFLRRNVDIVASWIFYVLLSARETFGRKVLKIRKISKVEYLITFNKFLLQLYFFNYGRENLKLPIKNRIEVRKIMIYRLK